MRPYIGPQQHHQPQQYGAHDNCLKQQQQHPHFLKAQHQQQHQPLFQQNYQHQQQHSLQQQQQPHNHNNGLQQTTSTVPPPHMWNHPHLQPNCYSGLGISNVNHSHTTSTAGNTIPINLQNCRPFPTTRPFQQHHTTHTLPHYTVTSSGFPVHQNSERIALTAAPNYAKLPPLSVVNQQRINECAGIPLISTATAHLTPGQRQRISRKQSHSPPGKNWANVLNSSSTATTSYAQYSAAHAQGAPLMLQKQSQQQQKADFWPHQIYATKTNGQYTTKQLDRTRTPLRYQNSAPAALTSAKSKENLDIQLKHSCKDTENLNSTNGESNSNEACLPRIIKPRKRRKKDRKPVNNLMSAVYLKMDTKSYQEKSNSKSSEDLMKGLQKLPPSKGCQEENYHLNKPIKTGLYLNDLIHGQTDHNTFNTSQCKSLTKDVNHGICFCNECDPLRSLWDYPLRRSLSDSSATSESSGTGSLSDNTTASCSESNWPTNRAEIVGVIGSKRNRDTQNNSNKSYSNTFKPTNILNENSIYNDNILSGINLAGELFKTNNSMNFITSPVDNLLLLPETAETLLTRSINEISKKLIETCSNETSDFPLSSCNSLSSFSTTSSNSSSANSTCADFSNDSGIESAHINAGDDLVFNFDNLHITTAKTTKSTLSPSPCSSSSASSSTSFSSTSTPSASKTTSSCGNISMSSSPTVKFAKNFLTTPTLTTLEVSSAAATNSLSSALTPSTTQMGLTSTSPSPSLATVPAPTLDFLVDLNNNHLHVATTPAPTTTAKTMMKTENNQIKQQKLQFNDLLPQNHQPPQQQRQQLTPTQQQFFNNCFDLMWQQEHEKQLTNDTNTNSSNNNTTVTSTTPTTNTIRNPYPPSYPHQLHHHHIDQLSSTDVISNNVAMSSFLDSVGSLKTVFSTIY